MVNVPTFCIPLLAVLRIRGQAGDLGGGVKPLDPDKISALAFPGVRGVDQRNDGDERGALENEHRRWSRYKSVTRSTSRLSFILHELQHLPLCVVATRPLLAHLSIPGDDGMKAKG
jgi:hypothetical protein